MTNENSKWAELQVTKEQAIEMYNSGVWKEWDAEKTVRFQLFQKRLCVEFNHFHSSIEKVLGREVYTHEFAFRDELVKEYLGAKDAPTLDEIISLIPAGKTTFIV